MKNQNLVIKYQGKRKEISLVIEECPDDLEIRTQLQDPNYEAEWKTAYLASHYEEKLNNQKESREDRHTSLESFTYEKKEYFSSKQEQLKEEVDYLLSLCNENQQEVLTLHFIEGYSKTEIAKMRNVDESAIRKTIERAIATVKRKL